MQRLAGEGQGAACASYAGISQPPTAEIGEANIFGKVTPELPAPAATALLPGVPPTDRILRYFAP